MASLLIGLALSAQAQEAPPPPPDVVADTMPTPIPPPAEAAPQLPVVIPPKGRPSNPGMPPRPTVPGRSDPSEALKELVREFQSARQAFLAEQKDLLNEIRDATAEQRAMIRMQLKDNLNAWLQEQKAQIQELREQARQIRNNVPALQEMIDAASNEGRDR